MKVPLYKTTLRQGTLSSTGSSTNFIVEINCQTKKPVDYWILHGTAFFCSYD